jgi:hypothetical protein
MTVETPLLGGVPLSHMAALTCAEGGEGLRPADASVYDLSRSSWLVVEDARSTEKAIVTTPTGRHFPAKPTPGRAGPMLSSRLVVKAPTGASGREGDG